VLEDNLHVILSSARSFGRVPPPREERSAAALKHESMPPVPQTKAPSRKYPPYRPLPQLPSQEARPRRPAPVGKLAAKLGAPGTPSDSRPSASNDPAATPLSIQEATEVILSVVAAARDSGESRLALNVVGHRCRQNLPAGRKFPQKSLSQLHGVTENCDYGNQLINAAGCTTAAWLRIGSRRHR
jgi:hypothetical protein